MVPAIDIAARRSLDTKAVLANLTGELGRWKTLAQQTLPTHRSQIQAAHDTLEVLLTRLNDKPPKRAETFTRMVLSAHRVWDFYRTKFEQRTNAELELFLEIADQLAYDCFEPVTRLLKKVPPLVVLTGASQPYVQRRESPFSVEGVATQEGLDALATQATAQLPFPVVGLPWSQPAQLAGLSAVAHEIGHAVEDDVGCTPALQDVFSSQVERAADWKRWQRELFADMWGCLCCGPAFAFALADHLAPNPPWPEPIDPLSVYPPAWLRIRFAFRVLEKLDTQKPFPSDVDARCRAWEAMYPFDPALKPYLDDVGDLAERLLAADLPQLGVPRQSTLRFTPEQHSAAVGVASRWLPTSPRTPPVSEGRMRVAVAAFRLAYEMDPIHVATHVRADDVMKKTLKSAVHIGYRAALPGYETENRARAAMLWDLMLADAPLEVRVQPPTGGEPQR
jgi:hypothetical protein